MTRFSGWLGSPRPDRSLADEHEAQLCYAFRQPADAGQGAATSRTAFVLSKAITDYDRARTLYWPSAMQAYCDPHGSPSVRRSMSHTICSRHRCRICGMVLMMRSEARERRRAAALQVMRQAAVEYEHPCHQLQCWKGGVRRSRRVWGREQCDGELAELLWMYDQRGPTRVLRLPHGP